MILLVGFLDTKGIDILRAESPAGHSSANDGPFPVTAPFARSESQAEMDSAVAQWYNLVEGEPALLLHPSFFQKTNL